MLFDEDSFPTGEPALVPIRNRAMDCMRCMLSKSRRKVVFGVGKADRPILAFLGEAPGENEDLSGEPFVGNAGKLLDKMIAAMGLKREDVYILNVINCRPPENRDPTKEELEACREFWTQQLRAVRPQVIVALGKVAAVALMKKTMAVHEFRGKWFEWEGIPVRVTFHPAYLIRQVGASSKKEAWDDLQEVMARVGLKKGESNGI